MTALHSTAHRCTARAISARFLSTKQTYITSVEKEQSHFFNTLLQCHRYFSSILYFHKDSKMYILKCPYYGFLKITFHAVCHVAVCEHKLSEKL